MSRSSPFGATYFEDPTVAQVCAAEYDRLWGRISFKVQNGVWFPRAREQVLAEELPDILKAFGKPVADRVSKAIQHTAADRLPKAATNAVKAANGAACTAYLLQARGRVSWINRLCIGWFGHHLY